MRRLLTFACKGEPIGASLDDAAGATGVLIVTGGSQTRIGAHRLFERLTLRLADEGFPCLRFDRRGVGDSGGADPGYRASGPDIAAAAAALRREVPPLERVIGLGLCDGATALALQTATAGVDALILINPWLIEAEADAPPPAAIRRHYRDRLLSKEGWRMIITGAVSYRKLLQGVAKIAKPPHASSLALDVAAALRRGRRPTALILAEGDATAVAAAAEIKGTAFAGLIGSTRKVATDSHTFAKAGDSEALLAAVLAALRAI